MANPASIQLSHMGLHPRLDGEALLARAENLCREQGDFMPREQWRERVAARLEG